VYSASFSLLFPFVGQHLKTCDNSQTATDVSVNQLQNCVFLIGFISDTRIYDILLKSSFRTYAVF